MFSAGFWLPLGNTEKAGFATFDHMNAAFPNRIHAAPNTAYKASLARACQKGIYVACFWLETEVCAAWMDFACALHSARFLHYRQWTMEKLNSGHVL